VSVIGSRLAGLVHAQAQGDATERARHERFIVSRMTTGTVALACLPPCLVWRGVPSTGEYLAFICLVLPLVAAVLLIRTGSLALAHGVSSFAFTGLIACTAAWTGGLSSAAAIWLVAVPLEALVSGSRSAAVAATVVAALGALLIAALEAAGLLPTVEPWLPSLAVPVFTLAALAHAASLAFVSVRSEAVRRDADRARDAQDRILLQAIDDLVTWHDRNGHVIKASPAAAKLLGVAPAALNGRGLFARVHVSDRPAFLKAISDAAMSERPVAVAFRLHLGEPASGVHRVLWVEMRAHRIETSATDEGCAVVAVTRDISEHRRQTEELDQARAAAEKADLLKGRFLATVSHELRTPLNAIIGFSEILASTSIAVEEERRREYAEIIRGSGNHLLEVVNTLLDMSKIETGNVDFAPEAFDLAELIHGCCDLIGLRSEQAGVRLIRDIVSDLPDVVADRRACRQILINLLSNAVKFTPRAGQVTVALRRERNRVLLSVTDTGVGIGEEDLPRLGDPFFQAGPVFERKHEGTGLGLSVVRGLVGLHRGTLSVESGLGQGTCVTVALPFDCRDGGSVQGTGAVQVLAFPRRRETLALKTG
jgi:cell cycle sensor histidine kinase DivJ